MLLYALDSFGIGFALSIVGSIMLFIGLTTLFAILYSVGIIVSLIGTGFLVGFLRQLKLMFKPVRIVATMILFGAFILVWYVALHGATEHAGLRSCQPRSSLCLFA